jgi:hypothetical protein
VVLMSTFKGGLIELAACKCDDAQWLHLVSWFSTVGLALECCLKQVDVQEDGRREQECRQSTRVEIRQMVENLCKTRFQRERKGNWSVFNGSLVFLGPWKLDRREGGFRQPTTHSPTDRISAWRSGSGLRRVPYHLNSHRWPIRLRISRVVRRRPSDQSEHGCFQAWLVVLA